MSEKKEKTDLFDVDSSVRTVFFCCAQLTFQFTCRLSGKTLMGKFLFRDAGIVLHSVEGGDIREDGSIGDVITGRVSPDWGGPYCFTVAELPCTVPVNGDVNADGMLTAADIVYLVGYNFKGGPDPQPCTAAADVNCDLSIRQVAL